MKHIKVIYNKAPQKEHPLMKKIALHITKGLNSTNTNPEDVADYLNIQLIGAMPNTHKEEKATKIKSWTPLDSGCVSVTKHNISFALKFEFKYDPKIRVYAVSVDFN